MYELRRAQQDERSRERAIRLDGGIWQAASLPSRRVRPTQAEGEAADRDAQQHYELFSSRLAHGLVQTQSQSLFAAVVDSDIHQDRFPANGHGFGTPNDSAGLHEHSSSDHAPIMPPKTVIQSEYLTHLDDQPSVNLGSVQPGVQKDPTANTHGQSGPILANVLDPGDRTAADHSDGAQPHMEPCSVLGALQPATNSISRPQTDAYGWPSLRSDSPESTGLVTVSGGSVLLTNSRRGPSAGRSLAKSPLAIDHAFSKLTDSSPPERAADPTFTGPPISPVHRQKPVASKSRNRSSSTLPLLPSAFLESSDLSYPLMASIAAGFRPQTTGSAALILGGGFSSAAVHTSMSRAQLAHTGPHAGASQSLNRLSLLQDPSLAPGTQTRHSASPRVRSASPKPRRPGDLQSWSASVSNPLVSPQSPPASLAAGVALGVAQGGPVRLVPAHEAARRASHTPNRSRVRDTPSGHVVSPLPLSPIAATARNQTSLSNARRAGSALLFPSVQPQRSSSHAKVPAELPPPSALDTRARSALHLEVLRGGRLAEATGTNVSKEIYRGVARQPGSQPQLPLTKMTIQLQHRRKKSRALHGTNTLHTRRGQRAVSRSRGEAVSLPVRLLQSQQSSPMLPQARDLPRPPEEYRARERNALRARIVQRTEDLGSVGLLSRASAGMLPSMLDSRPASTPAHRAARFAPDRVVSPLHPVELQPTRWEPDATPSRVVRFASPSGRAITGGDVGTRISSRTIAREAIDGIAARVMKQTPRGTRVSWIA